MESKPQLAFMTSAAVWSPSSARLTLSVLYFAHNSPLHSGHGYGGSGDGGEKREREEMRSNDNDVKLMMRVWRFFYYFCLRVKLSKKYCLWTKR
ncbi:uncharacterized protein DS421_13g411860 [Arachis hypogaea]|nr:uncharacterized protein DS421_13g411860 [Arachis hypogaea]